MSGSARFSVFQVLDSSCVERGGELPRLRVPVNLLRWTHRLGYLTVFQQRSDLVAPSLGA